MRSFGGLCESDMEVYRFEIAQRFLADHSALGVASSARLCQAIAQVVPVWLRPITMSRRRFNAAQRWCSQ
jgi:hypothetical protein